MSLMMFHLHRLLQLGWEHEPHNVSPTQTFTVLFVRGPASSIGFCMQLSSATAWTALHAVASHTSSFQLPSPPPSTPRRGHCTRRGAMPRGYGHEQPVWTCAVSLATHFKNCDSHWKPSAYPMRLATLTMKSSTGRATSARFLAS